MVVEEHTRYHAELAAVEALEADHALLPPPPDLGRVIRP